LTPNSKLASKRLSILASRLLQKAPTYAQALFRMAKSLLFPTSQSLQFRAALGLLSKTAKRRKLLFTSAVASKAFFSGIASVSALLALIKRGKERRRRRKKKKSLTISLESVVAYSNKRCTTHNTCIAINGRTCPVIYTGIPQTIRSHETGVVDETALAQP
jgi:hypothetical protein